MPRMHEQNISPKAGYKSGALGQGRSEEVVGPMTPEERRAAFESYIASAEFESDCEQVGAALLNSDEVGLVEFGSQDAPQRAAARAAEIRHR